MSAAGGPVDLDPVDRDTAMTGTYVQVLLVEAAILVLLWIFGRLYS